MKALKEQEFVGGESRRVLTPGHLGQSEPVVIVGTGPAGVRAARELLSQSHDLPIKLIGEEPWPPYNRVQLSALLAGSATLDSVQLTLPDRAEYLLERISDRRITSIDRRCRQVVDETGYRHSYRRLIIATGSRALRPPVPGMELPGVYTFRNLHDVQALSEHRGVRNIVILGGGLLGMEAARGMLMQGSNVTVIEAGERLMPRQLDRAVAERLRASAAALGINVRLGLGISAVEGHRHVESVRLLGGERLPCDVLIVAAGIAPNVELAKQTGLAVNRGICVNDRMQTSDPFIYAVGECAEHDGRLYGLAGPGLEQARIAALAVGGHKPVYRGSCDAAKLKLFDNLVFSTGRVTEEDLYETDRVNVFLGAEGSYRKIVTHRGRLVGAEAFGDWDEVTRLPDAVRQRKWIWPWQRWRFVRGGRLLTHKPTSVANWPESATVCNCMSVSKGTIAAACQGGADSVATLSSATGAGSVCGSCRPLLAEMLGKPNEEKATGRLPLTLFSALAAMAALAVLLAAPLAVSESVQSGFSISHLWEDHFYKQVTGFSLLGLSLLGLSFSLRKHLPRLRWGRFAKWRVFHAGMGLSALALLAAHTGLSIGENLNRLLMLDFLALSATGAATGTIFALARPLRVRTRRWSAWIHLLLGWPLPVLLSFHIASVYYF